MNVSERNIRILGVALLVGFTSTVAAVYWDLPGRLRLAVSGGSTDQKTSRTQPPMMTAGAGRCPVYHGQESDTAMTANAQAGAAGGCCAKKLSAAKHGCGIDSAACEHGKATEGSPASAANASASLVQPAHQPKQEPHAH